MKKTLQIKIENLGRISRKRVGEIVARSTTGSAEVNSAVSRIISAVRDKGDEALLKYTRKFDKAEMTAARIRVKKTDIRKAFAAVSTENPELVTAIRTTLGCVWSYHENELAQLKRRPSGWNAPIRSDLWPEDQSINVGQIRTPVGRVGVYVPGGNAALLTSALMAITPAKVAGVEQVLVASPPSADGDIADEIMVAADLAGADLVVRAGGAQAIAAMAYGTKSVPRVDMIVGPGNAYVAAAKCAVAANGVCGIDFPAGPSEILVVADETAHAEYVMRDMLSQVEHGEDSAAVLVTTSKQLAQDVKKLLANELKEKAGSPAQRALSAHGAILVADSIGQAIGFANYYAPEHLVISTKEPRSLLPKIRNAGGIFLGPYSAVAVGDYVCPNHILPTGGAARFCSGLSVDTFIKKPSVLEVPPEMAGTLSALVGTLSKAEGLYEHHGRAAEVRTGNS